MILRVVLILAVLQTALGLSCAGQSSPVETGGLTTPAANGNNASHAHIIGYYDVLFDIENGAFEAIENRSAGFKLNIVPFLNQMASPPNGISFANIALHQDDPEILGVDVEFIIHHPFPGIHQYDVYDVMGIVIGDGTDALKYRNLKTARQGSDLWMKNADGFTRWFNPVDFTTDLIFGYAPGGWQNLIGDSQVNPYKYYAKGLDPDENVWDFLTSGSNNDGLFESGSGRLMELEFPMPPGGLGIMFGYAVAVTWEEQGAGPYYPVHQTEAVTASLNQTPSVWFDGSESGGKLILDIDLFAWEHQPDTLKIESSVLDDVESFDSSHSAPSGENVSTWHIEVEADDFTGIERHDVRIIAEYNDFDYKNDMPGIPSPDDPLASFFYFPLYISDEPIFINSPPVVNMITDDAGSPGDYQEEFTTTPVDVVYTVDFTDPDSGDLWTYEWHIKNNWDPDLPTGAPFSTSNPSDPVNWGGTYGWGRYGIFIKVDDGTDFDWGGPYKITVNDAPEFDPETISGDATPSSTSIEIYSVSADDINIPAGDSISYDWTVTRVSDFAEITSGVVENGDELEVDWGTVGASDTEEYTIDCSVSDLFDATDDAIQLEITIDDSPPDLTWSQYQDTPYHSGDITKEEDLYPPLELDWAVELSKPLTMVYIPHGTPIIGDGYIMVMYTANDDLADDDYAYAEFRDFETGDYIWDVQITQTPSNGGITGQTGCFANGLFFCPGTLLRAIDPSTEQVVWSYPATWDGLSLPPSDSWYLTRNSPVYYDGKIFIRLRGDIYVLDADTGAVIDNFDMGGGTNMAMPFSVRDETVFAQEIILSGSIYYGIISAYDIATGIQDWTFQTDAPISGIDAIIYGSPTVPGDGKVYFGNQGGYYYCINQSDGLLDWRITMNSPGSPQSNVTSSAVSNGYLYYGEKNQGAISCLACLDINDDGSQVWEYSKPGATVYETWSTSVPVVANGVVYAGDENDTDNGVRLVACDAVSGDLLWYYDAPGAGWGDPAVVGGKLFIQSGFQDRPTFANPYGKLWCFKNQ